MTAELLPLPEFPVAVERFILSSLGPMKSDGARTELRTMLRSYARANVAHATAAKDAEIEALRAEGMVDAIGRAYGYLWHVNRPEDVPAGHQYLSADRAAYEGRKELRDLLTNEQRGAGINWVRQKLLAAAQGVES